MFEFVVLGLTDLRAIWKDIPLRRWTYALGLNRQNFMTIDGMTRVLDQLADSKMLVDQIREQRRRDYGAMKTAIRENGRVMLQQQPKAERHIADE